MYTKQIIILVIIVLSGNFFFDTDLHKEKEMIRTDVKNSEGTRSVANNHEVKWGTIKGVVVNDHTGEELHKAQVQILNKKRESNTITCPEGVFLFKVLTPGQYILAAKLEGYEEYRSPISVSEKTSRVTVRLKPSVPFGLSNINQTQQSR